ncbi:MAG: hypothetical protein ACI841_001077 [Planctomycetota bacterium]|jgi:hypothetical protein
MHILTHGLKAASQFRGRWSLGLAGALALTGSSCDQFESSSSSKTKVIEYPFHTPFDFKDSFYLANGVDPDGFPTRLTADSPEATLGESVDENRNGTRILSVLGGYDAAGALLYYPKPPAPMMPATFTDDDAGDDALALADSFRAFLFPLADAPPLSSVAGERRQGNVFDTSSGYFHTNPLGLWRLTFPHYTDAALNTVDGMTKLDALRERNGEDKDGTPLLKRLSEINELEDLGYLELLHRADDGSEGPPWVV